MSGDKWRRVRPGEVWTPSADFLNTGMDALDAWKAEQQKRLHEKTPSIRQAGIVLVRNDSGADRDQYDILGLGDPIISHSTNAAEFGLRPTFQGEQPTASGYTHKFCLLLEPIADGKFGYAMVDGVWPAKVEVGNALMPFADVSQDSGVGTSPVDYTLTAGLMGAAEILAIESGTGTKYGLVRLGQSAAISCWGTLDGPLGGSGTSRIESQDVSVYLDGSATWDADSAINVTAHAPPVLQDPDELPTDSWARVTWDRVYRRWVATAAECVPEGT